MIPVNREGGGCWMSSCPILCSKILGKKSNLIGKLKECWKCPAGLDKNNQSCYNLCVVCQPVVAKNVNVVAL